MAIVCAVNAISESLVRRYDHVKAHLSERQRRVWLGAEARELGAGGVRVVAAAAGVSPGTGRRGRGEPYEPPAAGARGLWRRLRESRGIGCVGAVTSLMPRSRRRWAVRAGLVGDVNGPRCWRRGWWGRWTPWLSPSLAVTG